jgi:peptidoglycan/LPS O-acetylase OafA/YrhL
MFSTAAPVMGGLEPGADAKPRTKHIAYLDGLRAIAVLAVLLRHAWGLSGSPALPLFGRNWTPIMTMLSSGVDLFFVLSGFLLARSFLRARQTGEAPTPFRVYWSARLRRIGPPYWIVLFLVLLLMTGTYIPDERVFSGDGLAIFAAHATFMQAAYLPSFGAYSVETPFWTLTIEMIFYLMLPFLVRLFFGKRWIVFTPVLALVAVGWLWMVRNSAGPLVDFVNGPINVFPAFPEEAVRFFLSHQMPAFLIDFSAGILAALIVTSKKYALRDNRLFQRVTSPTAGVVIFLLGTAVVLAAAWKLGTYSLTNGYANPLNYMTQDRPADLAYYYLESIPFGIGYGGMLLGLALATGWLQAIFSFRPLAYIGVIGYSVYLLHMPLLYVFNNYAWLANEGNPSRHFLFMLLAAVPTIILVSTLFFRAVERPAMEWSRKAHLPRRAATPPPVAEEPAIIDPPTVPGLRVHAGLPPAPDETPRWAVDDAVPGEYDRAQRAEERVRS